MAESARRRPWLLLGVLGLSVLVLAWAGALAAATALAFEPHERSRLVDQLKPQAGVVMLFVLLLPGLLWVALRPFMRAWPRAAARLCEELTIIGSAHAGHRVTPPPGSAPELRELAAAADALARRHAALRDEVDTRVAEARAQLADETRRLVALMSALPQGVVVCNAEGRVLLYNAHAEQVLAGDGAARTGDEHQPLGLGRALSGVLDADALDHAWQQLQRRQAQGDPQAVARFVTPRAAPGAGSDGVLLRARMVAIQGTDAVRQPGYVLLLDDITRSVLAQRDREALLLRLTEGSRAALANLRAAAQTLQQYPAMDATQRTRFTAVVHDEAERLAQQLGQALQAPGSGAETAWPREDLRLGDLVQALQHRLRDACGKSCSFDGVGAERWVEVDSLALVQLLTQLAVELVRGLALETLALRVVERGRFVRLDLCGQGPAPDHQQLQAWESALLASTGDRVRDVLDRLGAELWTLTEPPPGDWRLCLQLPAATPAQAAALPGAWRPIAYDFDLFHQAGQTAALDDTPLAALSYTVFDTETTGLRPSEGDEIIAIGAVRIVNQRLLEHERFDRLVRPRRPVRASAQAVHGIGMAQLEGEPPLEQVLPSFARFCADTVLVAHNAAFDMRFLELARERTGVRLDQPVLDTLLLSSVVQPGHGDDEHHLEQIATRLGVPVTARHQALGDAVVAAGVFLKLLPLLAARGIVTLGQARAASMRSEHARERF